MVREPRITRAGLIILLSCLATGCVSTQFSQIEAGPVEVSNLNLTTSDGYWNRAPGTHTGFLPKGAEMWTRDGLFLDRLIIFPEIVNGATLFRSNNSAIVYPEYRNGMLPNEIVEITVGSLTTFFGADTLVESSSLRPTKLAGKSAAMFNFKVTGNESPTLEGRALMFVEDDALNLLVFMATEIHYFERNWSAAESLFRSTHSS